MTNVVALGFTEADRIARELRRAGYVTADEVVELSDLGWHLAASAAELDHIPGTDVRSAVVALFGSPSLTGAQVPDALPSAAGCSPALLSEPVGRGKRGHGCGSIGSTFKAGA